MSSDMRNCRPVQERVAAVAPDVAARPGAVLAAGDLAADVVLRPVAVKRHPRALQHHQQLRLVGV
jgi:hypothetical protein